MYAVESENQHDHSSEKDAVELADVPVKPDVIECEAVPMDVARTKEKTTSVDGRWLWVVVLVAGLFKLALGIIALILLYSKFPRAMRLGALSGFGLKALLKRLKS